jgi:hypothetical protein
MKTWIDQIRQHATVHYTEDGWDFLVECWDDAYIYEVISDCDTYEEAVILVSEILSTLNDVRLDIQSA